MSVVLERKYRDKKQGVEMEISILSSVAQETPVRRSKDFDMARKWAISEGMTSKTEGMASAKPFIQNLKNVWI